MKNPFRFGDPVSGEFYLDRSELRQTVSTFLNNNINVVLVGPRRFGKTSFIINLQRHFRQDGFKTIYLDAFNVTSHRDFFNQLISALAVEQSFFQGLKAWILDLPKKLKPVISFESNASSPEMTVSLSTQKASDEDMKQLISSALGSLAGLDDHVCIAMDEFQTIGELDDKGWLEATIRSKMQLSKNVSFIFSGSRHGLIHNMFNDKARPFYRSCQIIDFPPLGNEFTDWIVERFNLVSTKCTPGVINYMRHLVDDTPNYVQMACFNLVAHEFRNINKGTVDEILAIITSQNSYAYQTLLNSLTPVQRRVLRLAACEGKSIFGKQALAKYEIKSASHVSQAINSLVAKQILDDIGTKNGSVIFDDPLFAIWLRKEFNKILNIKDHPIDHG